MDENEIEEKIDRLLMGDNVPPYVLITVRGKGLIVRSNIEDREQVLETLETAIEAVENPSYSETMREH